MKYFVPILFILLITIVLLFLFKMNKILNVQTTLMVGMAQKLGITDLPVLPARKIKDKETPEESEMIAEIADKIYDGKELTDEEKEFKKKFKNEIKEEIELLKGWNKNNEETKVPKNTPKKKERKKISREDSVLSLFENGIPKTSIELINLYAEKRGTKPNGSVHIVFNKMVKDNKLGRYNNYYGLIDWFDGKKMKKEFSEKINH